jgi:transcriptional regulator with XRE-family HTH domain
MPTPQQFQAARALLEWPQKRLAEAIGVAIITIKRLENSSLGASEETREKARRALEAAGVTFLGLDGVRLKRRHRT